MFEVKRLLSSLVKLYFTESFGSAFSFFHLFVLRLMIIYKYFIFGSHVNSTIDKFSEMMGNRFLPKIFISKEKREPFTPYILFKYKNFGRGTERNQVVLTCTASSLFLGMKR